jgi:hypothetical protein
MMRRIATIIAGSAAGAAMLTGLAVHAMATTGSVAASDVLEQDGVRITGHPVPGAASENSIFSSVDGSARDQ